MRTMISIPGSLSFAKLVMMSSTPAKSVGAARCASQDPFIQCCPIQSRLQSVLGVRSCYVEHNKIFIYRRPNPLIAHGALQLSNRELPDKKIHVKTEVSIFCVIRYQKNCKRDFQVVQKSLLKKSQIIYSGKFP